MLKDSATRYGWLSRLLHWGMALLIIQQFFKLGDYVDDGEHWLGKTFGSYHGSIGLLILGLVVLRLLWVAFQPQRPATEGRLALFARLGHWGLYACMLLMPLTAVALMIGKGWGVRFFGEQLIARSPEKIEWLATLGSFHAPLAWLFLLLILGHVAAALFHHFVLRDDTLRRMTRG